MTRCRLLIVLKLSILLFLTILWCSYTCAATEKSLSTDPLSDPKFLKHLNTRLAYRLSAVDQQKVLLINLNHLPPKVLKRFLRLPIEQFPAPIAAKILREIPLNRLRFSGGRRIDFGAMPPGLKTAVEQTPLASLPATTLTELRRLGDPILPPFLRRIVKQLARQANALERILETSQKSRG